MDGQINGWMKYQILVMEMEHMYLTIVKLDTACNLLPICHPSWGDRCSVHDRYHTEVPLTWNSMRFANLQ